MFLAGVFFFEAHSRRFAAVFADSIFPSERGFDFLDRFDAQGASSLSPKTQSNTSRIA